MPSRRTLLTSSAAGAALWVASAAAAPGAQAAALTGPQGQGRGRGKGRSRGQGRGVNFNVISDIQGDLKDFAAALADMAETNPDSAGLAVAGDITGRGYDFEYAAVRQVVDRAASVPAAQAWAIGNHEFYVPKYSSPGKLSEQTWPNGTTEDSLFRSFYTFAGRNKVYSEHSFGGVPVLCIGTEKYMKYHDPKLTDDVWMSDAQFAWLEDRLAYWTRRRQPVMVVSHHPLPNTVSGTHQKPYLRNYLQADRLLQVFGRYKDLFFFTGHTHWDLNLSDWYVNRVVPGTANLDGFHVINTGAIETGWKTTGCNGETTVPGPFNQGLQVEVEKGWVTIKARDFSKKEWIRQARVPLSTTR
jgi:hypothetical protein